MGLKESTFRSYDSDAWNHRWDALSSIGSLVGILGAKLGFLIFDPIVGVVICVFILKAAYSIFRDAVNKMTNKSCDEETIGKIHDLVDSQSGVVGINQLKTRLFGDRVYVDIEIQVDNDLSLQEAHDIAHRVHDAVENEFSKIKHCTVHVNPRKDS